MAVALIEEIKAEAARIVAEFMAEYGDEISRILFEFDQAKQKILDMHLAEIKKKNDREAAERASLIEKGRLEHAALRARFGIY